jgi:hypothetical protein
MVGGPPGRDNEFSQARSGMYCHPERSEGSLSMGTEMLRFAQHDNFGVGRYNSSSRGYTP